jgi:hypothetical protein
MLNEHVRPSGSRDWSRVWRSCRWWNLSLVGSMHAEDSTYVRDWRGGDLILVHDFSEQEYLLRDRGVGLQRIHCAIFAVRLGDDFELVLRELRVQVLLGKHLEVVDLRDQDRVTETAYPDSTVPTNLGTFNLHALRGLVE